MAILEVFYNGSRTLASSIHKTDAGVPRICSLGSRINAVSVYACQGEYKLNLIE